MHYLLTHILAYLPGAESERHVGGGASCWLVERTCVGVRVRLRLRVRVRVRVRARRAHLRWG